MTADPYSEAGPARCRLREQRVQIEGGGTGGTVPTTRLRYGDHASQWIDLSVPDDGGDRPLPVIVFLHGGYWRDLHAADQGESVTADLVTHRVAAVNVEYRRVGDDLTHGGGGWPATFLDVAAAIDRLAAPDLAGYGLDLARVVAVGHSAGGQLACWLTSRPGLPAGSPGAGPRVAISGYVSLAGVLDLVSGAEQHLDDDAVQGLLGGEPDDLAEVYALASPIERLPTGVPGVCLHGTRDDRVPFEQSERFVDAAVAAGDDCRLITLRGVDHFGYLDATSTAWRSARSAALRLLRQ